MPEETPLHGDICLKVNSKRMQKISIIGLGWLGLPLARYLKSLGYSIKGSCTTEEKAALLKAEGLDTYAFKLDPHPIGRGFHSLFDTDILVVNIPPKSRTMPESFHPEQIKFLKALAQQHGVKKVIFVSSTSVYPDLWQEARESDFLDQNTVGSPSILQAERLIWDSSDMDKTIIRFGGLLGVDRIPGKYFSGKSQVVGDSPVNYIHQQDAVAMISWIISQGLWNEVFNGVAPLHPARREVYEKNAEMMGFPTPLSYAEPGSPWKKVMADKILSTGFEFLYPDPLDFSYRKEG